MDFVKKYGGGYTGIRKAFLEVLCAGVLMTGPIFTEAATAAQRISGSF